MKGLPNALDVDPYRDSLITPTPIETNGPHHAESSSMARGESTSSSRTARKRAVPMQTAAMISEESLSGEGDGYVAVNLDEGSSSTVGIR